jgi:cell division protein FtsL
MARNATAAILTHEQVCAERWRSTMETMGDIKKVIVWGISSLVASMAFLIVYLWQHPHV